ncbi:MAG: AMP-binding protein [Gammaproteobacteria bacterium]|nr:AMP-binding protein [Gammaproteobacteria bacterium]MBL4898897.1 AMP-binding protein [Colwellia sp.]
MPGILKRLEFVASLIPEEPLALSSSKGHLSYASLIVEVQKRMCWFQSINAKVIALRAGNSIDWLVTDLACQELGLIFIPLPAFFTDDQIQQCLSSAGVDLLLSDQPISPQGFGVPDEAVEYSGKDRPWPFYAWKLTPCDAPILPEGTQKITFTSGSTGNPKGVCLSFDHQWQVAQSLADAIDIKCPKHLCLLPLSTLLENIAGVYTPLLSGGEVVVPSDDDRGLQGSSKLDAKVLLACISNVQPTTMILVPQLLMLLVQACMAGWQPPSTLKFVAVGGGKVSAQLIHKARSLGLPVFQGYGLSECGSVVALNTLAHDQLDSVGQVLPHCHVVVENNEVVVSDAVHLGYLGDPASWHPEKMPTGDIGSIKGGVLYINGRSKNILISSFGRNISPEWVESVLLSTPLLTQCVVLGDERPYLIALVTAPKQFSDVDIERHVDVCNSKLPDYAKVGSWLRLSDAEIQLYLTANGRPQREKMTQVFSDRINQLYVSNNNSAVVG